MAQTIKKLPAIILAVMMAAALSLTMGLTAQNAYAGITDEYNPQIHFIYDSVTLVYPDGNLDFELGVTDRPDAYDWEMNVKVGFVENPEDRSSYGWDHGWTRMLTDDCYSFDRETQTVTLYGPKIWEAAAQYYSAKQMKNYEAYVVVAAELVASDGDKTIHVTGCDSVLIVPVEVEYDTDDFDSKLLLTTSDTLSTVDGEVYNSEFPNGKVEPFNITSVVSHDASIVKVTKTEQGWECEGIALGKAKMTVTFEDYEGKLQSFDFTYTVVDEELDVGVEPVDGYYVALPGKSIALEAFAWHDIVTDQGMEEGKITGYSWSISAGKKYASVTKNKKDGSKATLKFKSSAKNKDIEVCVKVTAKNKKGKTITAKEHEEFYAETNFYQITPGKIPSELKVGESYTLTPKLMHYTTKKPEGTVMDGATFEYGFFDDESKAAVQVTPNADNTEFTLERKKGNWAGFYLGAYVEGSKYPQHEYSLDDVYYYLDGGRVLIDGEDWKAFTVDGKNGALNPDDINITVVDWNGEVVPEDAYTLKFYRSEGYDEQAEEDIWEEVTPPLTIGDADKEEGFSSFSVVAEAANEDVCLEKTDRSWFEVFDKYSLNYIGADVNFGNDFAEQSTWGWRNFYNVPYSEIKAPVVYALDGSVVPEDQYTLTYYNRPAGEADPDAILDNGKPLAGLPSDIGAYIVQIKANSGSDYYGSTYSAFNIGPDGTSLTKLGKAKKAFTAKWTKQTAGMPESQITGYEIQYSTDENFAKRKTKVVKGASKTSVKIKSLKKKTKYYVKIRTYITVDGADYYSPWSEVKTVKTK
ncbi:MAG: fibronectin type III domain-containing protein [Bacillota bacterium]|nr:fibronectin type III domain-containing protein [Bacillota bacterium]